MKVVRRAHHTTLFALASSAQQRWWLRWFRVTTPWYAMNRSTFGLMVGLVALPVVVVALANLPTDSPNGSPVPIILGPMVVIVVAALARNRSRR